MFLRFCFICDTAFTFFKEGCVPQIVMDPNLPSQFGEGRQTEAHIQTTNFRKLNFAECLHIRGVAEYTLLLKGAVAKFGLFFFTNQSFWNLHTISEIESRINFYYKFHLFNFFCWLSHFFRKKHLFTPLLKGIEVGEF